MMFMLVKQLKTLRDLQQYFSMKELLYYYGSGTLEIWLREIGEVEKADKVSEIPKANAYILLRLYEILGFNLELSEEEIRSQFSETD